MSDQDCICGSCNRLMEEISQLHEDLSGARLVISFYAKEENWIGNASKLSNIYHDSKLPGGIPGQLARNFLEGEKK
jgi:hypothetical protein